VSDAPFYLPVGDEVRVFTAAWEARLPVLLKGPTGCGKTRFVEYMAATLPRRRPAATALRGNLITVACHEDLTGSDLVGRYLIKGDETVWIDGPLTRAVREGRRAPRSRGLRRSRERRFSRRHAGRVVAVNGKGARARASAPPTAATAAPPASVVAPAGSG